MVNAESAGSYYRNVIQSFGPAERLGAWRNVHFQIIPLPVPAAVGTPKDLKVTESTVWSPRQSSSTFTNTTFFLKTPERQPLRRHTVTFDANNRVNEHSLNVVSVDNAVEEVLKIAEMLGLEFKITKVVTHFE